MFAASAALALTLMLVVAWYGGVYLERFLASDYCWPIARRAAYATMILAIGRGIFDLMWRFLT